MEIKYIIDINTTVKEFIYKKISRNFYGYLKEHNVVYLVNGKETKSYENVNIGDILVISYIEEKNEKGFQSDLPIDILYEDSLYLVVDKPYNLQSIPSKGNPYDSVYNRLLHYFKDSNNTVHLINRLDKETKGLILVAKSNYARAILKDFDKIYYASTKYPLPIDSGEIDLPILKVEGTTRREISSNGQSAITIFELYKEENDLYTYKVILKTGRTHQIRLHFSYNDSPLINDKIYGIYEGGELGLVCGEINFTNPITNKKIIIKSKY